MSINLKTIQPEKILIRATNWIGDAIMTTPAVRTIRRNFPQAEISILVHPWVADVFSASPDVDKIILYHKKTEHRGISGIWRLSRELKKNGFDLAILLQNAFEAALIAYLSAIPLRAGYRRDLRGFLLTHPVNIPWDRKKVHQVYYYQGLLNDLGLQPGPDELFLAVQKQDKEKAERLFLDKTQNGPLIGLNPGASYGPAKRWPAEKYAELAMKLREKFKARIAVFGTKDDRKAALLIKKSCEGQIIDLTGRTSLSKAMALIDSCAVFVTNDSGLMHVAAALKTPLVAVFGSTNPVTTGPFSPNATILRKELPCSPCMQTHCKKNAFACMEKITADEALSEVEKLLPPLPC